jgi:uncharacterized protein (TIRG00374 family)
VPPSDDANAGPGRTSNLRSAILRIVVLAAAGVALWLVSRRIVDWAAVRDAVIGLTAADWALLGGVAAARLAVEPLLLMASTPNLTWPRALPGFLAPAATASVIPGPSDLAARYAMFRSWGYSGAQTSASVMLVFLFTTFAKVALPAVAAAILLAFGRSTSRMMAIAAIAIGAIIGGATLIALLLRSEQTARRIGHAVGTAAHRIARWFRIRAPESLAADLADRAAHFRDRTGHVIRSRSHLAWPAAAAGQAALFVILLVSVRVVGIGSDELDWVAIFAAFAMVQLLTSVPITPSGLGVAEAAYVTLLAAGAASGFIDEVTAAAIIYRVFSWLIVIPLGGVAWLWWSRRLGARDR